MIDGWKCRIHSSFMAVMSCPVCDCIDKLHACTLYSYWMIDLHVKLSPVFWPYLTVYLIQFPYRLLQSTKHPITRPTWRLWTTQPHPTWSTPRWKGTCSAIKLRLSLPIGWHASLTRQGCPASSFPCSSWSLLWSWSGSASLLLSLHQSRKSRSSHR